MNMFEKCFNQICFKRACVACLISLALVFPADLKSAASSTEIEPELEQLLADNPDIAGLSIDSKQVESKQDVRDLSQTNQVSSDERCKPAEAKESELQLNAIAQAFDSIFHDYLFIDQTTSLDQTKLCSIKLFIENEISGIRKILEESTGKSAEIDRCKHDMKVLCEIIYWFKFACLYSELLSVSSEDSRLSSIKDPLNFVEMQQAKLEILFSLFEQYSGSQDRVAQFVASIIFENLPERFKIAASLSKILNQNFYAENIVLSEEYFEIVSTFYKTQKFGEAFDVVSFLTKIDGVISAFAKNIRSMLPDGKDTAVKLLLAKLIKIRNHVSKFYQPILGFRDENQEKAKLFIRFKLLFEDKRLEVFCRSLEFRSFFDLYSNVVKTFFVGTTEPAEMEIKLFEVEIKLNRIISDRNASLRQAILSYYIDRKWIFWSWVLYLCKNPSSAFLDDMEGLLVDIKAFVSKSIKSNAKGFFANIKDAIFSGKWIDSGQLKGLGIGSTQTVVDFMEYLSDRKFENFKEAAFFFLARFSPVLAAGLIYKVMPHLSADLRKQASDLVGEAGPEGVDHSYGSGAANKIFEFISKNPGIFDKLCEVNPGLINGLADVVQAKLKEAAA